MSASTVLALAGAKKPPNAGKGRAKGVPNKTTSVVRDMVTQALDQAGGIAYLVERAHDPRTAAAFLTLVGKVLPLQVTGANDAPIALSVAFVRASVVVDPAA